MYQCLSQQLFGFLFPSTPLTLSQLQYMVWRIGITPQRCPSKKINFCDEKWVSEWDSCQAANVFSIIELFVRAKNVFVPINGISFKGIAFISCCSTGTHLTSLFSVICSAKQDNNSENLVSWVLPLSMEPVEKWVWP